jgi:hypothetical protein
MDDGLARMSEVVLGRHGHGGATHSVSNACTRWTDQPATVEPGVVFLLAAQAPNSALSGTNVSQRGLFQCRVLANLLRAPTRRPTQP